MRVRDLMSGNVVTVARDTVRVPGVVAVECDVFFEVDDAPRYAGRAS